jgi:hypothetical protein
MIKHGYSDYNDANTNGVKCTVAELKARKVGDVLLVLDKKDLTTIHELKVSAKTDNDIIIGKHCFDFENFIDTDFVEDDNIKVIKVKPITQEDINNGYQITMEDIKAGRVAGVSATERSDEYNTANKLKADTMELINRTLDEVLKANVDDIYTTEYSAEPVIFYDDMLKIAKEAEYKLDPSITKLEFKKSSPFASFKTETKVGLRISFELTGDFPFRADWFYDPILVFRWARMRFLYED